MTDTATRPALVHRGAGGDAFQRRHIGTTRATQERMLAAIGVPSVDALLDSAVPAAIRAKTLVVFVTTDPKRDSGSVIRKWLSQYTGGVPAANWIGLRGDQAQIDAAQAAAHVAVAADHGQTHSLSVLLYGPDDYAHVSFALTDTERQQMVHDLPIVAAQT